MRKLVFILAIVFAGVSCDTSPNLVNCDFDEKAMLTNYADEIIIPRHADLSLSLLLFESSVTEFASNPTIGLLNEARIFYGTAYEQYQKCSMFAFGPGLIGGVRFTERFNTFPTNIAAISANVSSGTMVASSAKSAVGFPAIDYLLFSEPGTSNEDVLALFTTDPLASNRISYLQQLTLELKSTADAIEEGWIASGGNYRETFINNIGTATGTSIGMLVNDFNFDFETLKNFKFKIPLGKFNGGVVIPEQVEAYYAGGSARLAQKQVDSFKKVFEGTGENGANGIGLYEYLVCLETEATSGGLLADDILGHFETIVQHVNEVQDPMSEQLTTDFSTVDNAYTQLQMMVPKIKYDMTTALGVQINYQDNDGD